MSDALLTLPYCGVAPLPADLWSRWNLDPIVIGVLLAASLYATRLPSRRAGYWLAALGVLFIAFVSPLCALTSALFSARSVHHLLTATFAAPLLAMAIPQRSAGNILAPLLLSSLVLWLWHWPPVYAATFESHGFYWALQLSLLGTFVWFWREALAPAAEPAASLLAIGASAGQMGLLAALLTLAPRPLYEAHALAPLNYGLDALRDQQIAGLFMWAPAFFIYAAFAIAAGRRLNLGAGA
ncbi:MAG: cytochrome c oxidase assembly protein [Beijerinckiaceae bacterium]|nr:cytochrome c oxidase assembly protein [Beijerinckiaceae bacterium]